MSDKTRMNAAEAGRKGGRSRSDKKLAAIKRNGFQRVYPRPDEQPAAPEAVTKLSCINCLQVLM